MTLYVIVYVPITFISTVLDAIIDGVIFPSSGSCAVAPGSTNGVPTIHDRGLLPTSVITGAWFPPPHVVHVAGTIVRSNDLISDPQLFVATKLIVLVVAVVGVPEIIPFANDNPVGNVDEPILYDNVVVAVDDAVILYENGWPTIPFAVKADVMIGTRHCGACVTITCRVVLAERPPESVTV